jgi:hypothetical protein
MVRHERQRREQRTKVTWSEVIQASIEAIIHEIVDRVFAG